MFPSREDIKKLLDEYVIQRDGHMSISKFIRKSGGDFGGMSINTFIYSPHMWYYFMENNANHVPEYHQLRKTCDEPSCISHYVLCSKKWSKQTNRQRRVYG